MAFGEKTPEELMATMNERAAQRAAGDPMKAAEKAEENAEHQKRQDAEIAQHQEEAVLRAQGETVLRDIENDERYKKRQEEAAAEAAQREAEADWPL